MASSSSSSAFSMRRVGLLRGHSDAVACLAATADGRYLASGGEDGTLCIHSLTDYQLLAKAHISDDDAVAAVVFQPVPSSSSSSSSSIVLFAATGRELQQVQLSIPDDQQSEAAATAAADQALFELRVVVRELVAVDDISALAVNQQGTYLAAADDSGDVTIFDLVKLGQQLQQQLPQKQLLLQPHRSIKAAHDPLASAVLFRKHKPWQILTAGMDSKVSCWDFSRSRRCCAVWNMSEMTDNVTQDNNRSDKQQHDGGSQMWNPPMVHALAVPWESSSSSRSGPVQGSATLLKRVVAAARGDGVVAVFDADGDAKPGVRTAAAVAAATSDPRTNGSSSSSSSSRGKARSGSKGTSRKQQQAAGPAGKAVATAQAAQIGTSSTSQHGDQQQQQAERLQAGFCICLGASLGGHKVPASAVTFLPWGGGGRYLLSGGEDGRLLLWDWQAAATSALLGVDAMSATASANRVAATSTETVTATPAAPASAVAEVAGAAVVQSSQASEADTMHAARQLRCLLLERDHKCKVNALCCVQLPGQKQSDGCYVAVADTSRTVSVMQLALKK